MWLEQGEWGAQLGAVWAESFIDWVRRGLLGPSEECELGSHGRLLSRRGTGFAFTCCDKIRQHTTWQRDGGG